MKKQSEIGFLLVLTPVNQEINSKTFKLSNNPIIELEGFAITLIGVKLGSERIAKLNEILQKLGIEPLKDGDDRSEKLRLFIDKLHLHFFSENSISPLSEISAVNELEDNQCLHRVGDNRCSRFFLKKAKIIKVDLDFCSHCWSLQQNLALQTKVNPTPASPTISTFYKKPEKIFCIQDTLYIDPRKMIAKCSKCKLDRFKMWAECNRKQQYAKNSIPQKPT